MKYNLKDDGEWVRDWGVGGGRLWSPTFLDLMENWKMRYRSYPIWLDIRVDNEGGGARENGEGGGQFLLCVSC